MGAQRDFKGNKAHLPSKPCAVCGRTMTWRKSWAKNWDDVLYCSDACRRQRKASEREGTESKATQPKAAGR